MSTKTDTAPAPGQPPETVAGCVILTDSGEKIVVREDFDEVVRILDDPNVRTLLVHRPDGVDVAVPMRNVEIVWKRKAKPDADTEEAV
jgi:hypothetical protein